MFKICGVKLRVGAAIAAVAICAASAPASAAIYRGAWDPAYGAPFNNLTWRGGLEVVVPDACLPTGAGSISILGCNGIDITQAVVELHDKTTDALLQTMDFGAAAGSALSGLNWQLTFDGAQNLTGANSTAFASISGLAGTSQTAYGSAQAWFSLQFLGNYAQLYWFDNEPGNLTLWGVDTGIPDEVVLSAGATIFGQNVGGVCRHKEVTPVPYPLNTWVNPDNCGWSDPDEMSDGAFIKFSRVPEPGSAALAALALAGLGVVSSRTRRRRAARR